VTRDLKNFWIKTYHEMKKEWQREYPRHHWPDNPSEAKPVLLKRML
jgi:ATP-dependent helicase HrpB